MRRRLTHGMLLLAAVCLVPATATAQSRSPEEVAAAALRAAPVFDGHNDVPWALRERYRNVIAGFDFNDSTRAPAPEGEGPMHTDIRRLKAGRVGAQFWSVYVPATLSEPQAVVAVMEQIDVTKRLLARHPDVFTLVTTADGVEAAMKRGRIASIMGMEGGNSIGESLAVLRQTHDLGVRYLTLTHNKTLSWADAATDAPRHDGLNEFGRQVVREMNRLGMLVDLSHVSEATMMDALDESKAPVIFSHSGARAINGHARNVPDAVLRRLPANGGVVMVVGLPGFLSEELRQHAANRAGEQSRLESLWRGQPAEVTKALASWDAANPQPKVGLSAWADHVDHVRKLAGIDHIGIGGDYDGMPSGPVGAEDVAGYPALFAELARRGYTQAELEKIANRNIMRALRGAEATAAGMKAMPPIETPAVGT